jgi:predicted metal-binding protein
MVCLAESQACGLTQCANCPGSDAVYKLLSTMDNFESGNETTYRQCVMTDPSTLMTY